MNICLRHPQDLDELTRRIHRERNVKQRDRYRAVRWALDGKSSCWIADKLDRGRASVQRWPLPIATGASTRWSSGLSRAVLPSCRGVKKTRSSNGSTGGRFRGPMGACVPCGAGMWCGSSIKSSPPPTASKVPTTCCTDWAMPPSSPGHATARAIRKPCPGDNKRPPLSPTGPRRASPEAGRGLVPGRSPLRSAGHTHEGLGPEGFASHRRQADRIRVGVPVRGRQPGHGRCVGMLTPAVNTDDMNESAAADGSSASKPAPTSTPC